MEIPQDGWQSDFQVRVFKSHILYGGARNGYLIELAPTRFEYYHLMGWLNSIHPSQAPGCEEGEKHDGKSDDGSSGVAWSTGYGAAL
jgi:hypothetical protein